MTHERGVDARLLRVQHRHALAGHLAAEGGWVALADLGQWARAQGWKIGRVDSILSDLLEDGRVEKRTKRGRDCVVRDEYRATGKRSKPAAMPDEVAPPERR